MASARVNGICHDAIAPLMTAPKHNLDYDRRDPLVVPSPRSIPLTLASFVAGAWGGYLLGWFAVAILRPSSTPIAWAFTVLFPFVSGVAFAVVSGRTPPQKQVPPRRAPPRH